MITLTKLNGDEFVLNCDLIETVEENPDTTIRLTSKNLYIVREPMAEIVRKVIAFRRTVNDPLDRIRRDR